LGGAGLVMTEMVCVSPEGRISPGCTGLYTPEQEAAWTRVVDFVHTESDAKIGVQIGHSGRKGSTKVMWEGIDEPLPEGNWEIVGPSPIPYSPANAVPRELSTDELAGIREEFVAAARSAARAGFDVLELHCAHGYLLSSFVSPLANTRTDRYGGDLEGRLRYPLEVFDAMRAVWPAERPMTVRISATDWYDGGIDVDDAVVIARTFAEHGAAGIDVSTGQVVSEERPAFGRSYQTPFADRIRNEVGRELGVSVIAVGAISSWDDVNSILLAGRADLCALGRPHLYDPQWTLHAAAEQGYAGTAAPGRNRSRPAAACPAPAAPMVRGRGWSSSAGRRRAPGTCAGAPGARARATPSATRRGGPGGPSRRGRRRGAAWPCRRSHGSNRATGRTADRCRPSCRCGTGRRRRVHDRRADAARPPPWMRARQPPAGAPPLRW
jgi:anthraniloyl-CoA monooxygenase